MESDIRRHAAFSLYWDSNGFALLPEREIDGFSKFIETFEVAEEEYVRMAGEYMPLDQSPRARGSDSMCKRVTIGALII